MRKSNAFRPTSLDSLESRIALSGAGLGSLAGAAHVSGTTTEKGHHHEGGDQGGQTHQTHHTEHHHHAEHHHEHKPVK